MSASRKNKRKHWFHASARRFVVGTLLNGAHAHKKNFENCGEYVYITGDEIPHTTIVDEAVKEGWNVYEVEPHGKIKQGMWDDGMCKTATILRYVGTARGILNRLKRHTNPNRPKTGSTTHKRPHSIVWSEWMMCNKKVLERWEEEDKKTWKRRWAALRVAKPNKSMR